MRTIAMAVCVLLTSSAFGQLPPAGPERDKWLDAVLANWEKALADVTSLEASCERVTEDKVFKNREVYKGTAKYLKGNGPGLTSRASLHLVKTDNPKTFEHLILSGQFLYEVAPAVQEIRVHELPPPKAGQNVDHNLVGLLFGMKAAEAKARYKIELAHADVNYFFLLVESKTPADKADFERAQLALIRKTYLPRQLIFEQANGNKVSWDLPSIQTPAANVRPADFMQPNLPNYKLVRVGPQGLAPNKVRSSAN
jgi:TIGR03009 family protein